MSLWAWDEREAKSLRWVFGFGIRERREFEMSLWIWDKREAESLREKRYVS